MIGTWPDETRQTDRGDANRRVVGVSEELGRRVGGHQPLHEARRQRDALEGVDVVVPGRFGHLTAVEILPGEVGNPLVCVFLQVSDAWEADGRIHWASIA